ncbi:MAG: hypothetical protein ISS25_00295 [Nanoarchaeota archaeon]|nr:hypothetical protein [DPANN group archaeon]MBL7116257.1 hypothetical protein [Nanoarchaeota archaeon]
MRELEKEYLAKSIPKGLKNCEHKEVIDIYIPKESFHPVVRIRKNGDKFRVTKKVPVDDKGHFDEQTVKLTKEEFNALKDVDGRKVHKIRYIYSYKGYTAEIDVFQEPLKGLIIVEFEFPTFKEKDSFEMPDFCLADITSEEFTAGGFICGKSLEDLKKVLDKYGYKKLIL